MEALTQTFSVLAIAVVVSMVVAVIIKAIVTLLGRQTAGPAAATAPSAGRYPAAAAGTLGDDTGSLPPHHVAAIAAAVSTVMNEPQIVRIEPSRHGSGWTAEGRSAHRGSHNTGRSPRRPTR